ncbi:hypothetical protein AVEN_71200-1 [Araneus ventricosus]|uniref:Uncharacterized protein n=1 Tax=Araneus ventricosus TaxID=182803 RepID=A0A4Y2HRH2_ARAVE|nr:hypothetical protein AVEN_71200-1 [Araneus ventricosus]
MMHRVSKVIMQTQKLVMSTAHFLREEEGLQVHLGCCVADDEHTCLSCIQRRRRKSGPSKEGSRSVQVRWLTPSTVLLIELVFLKHR